MTDPGDLANTDVHEREDLPDTKRVNPGVGEEKLEEALQRNDKDEGEAASQRPDPLDL
ncbi:MULTISPECIES: hypothetical protein [Deinococcus]|uniref:Uncharacterized protein n=1 Tax=Deinococcus geothermalis (strain DSM 11300 / CIP 105573 / AG-3a) TaxID=319795 RepID=Q1J131_DEIGD|nr:MULTISPECIES: hypothetical protein [Deinococcus]ABF44803.1 hypothetical protein Dgeo_0501 [Deinococcus geothermalis DSM 11300]